MFSPLRLFQQLACPDNPRCHRPHCLYNHRTDLPPTPTLVVPLEHPISSSSRPGTSSTIPAKRPTPSSSTPGPSVSQEPPRKQQKITTNRSAPSAAQQPTTGPPLLRVNGASSVVPVPVRQAMLKTLYDHFSVLYEAILPTNPTLASEHALRQEEEVYKKSNKQTYRVVRRVLPPYSPINPCRPSFIVLRPSSDVLLPTHPRIRLSERKQK